MQKLWKRAVLLIAFLWLLGSALPVLALEDAGTRTVRVGFYHIEGYNVMDEAGARSGYGYEVLQAMRLYTNWKYEYIGYDKGWADIQQMLLDDEIDMVISAVKTPERMEIYDFSDRPVSQSGACLMVKAGGSPYVAGQYASYEGMRIGFIEGASQIAKTEAFAAEKGFRYTPVYYKTSGELEAAILAGRDVDAIVTSNMRIIAGTRRLELFAMQDVHAMVQKGNAALLSEINYALEQISLYSPDLYDSLYNKYYSVDAGDAVFFTPEESRFIAQCQADGTVLRTALVPNMSPYAYYVGEVPTGIFYDITTEIFRRAGLKSALCVTTTDAAYKTLVESGGVDVGLAARFDYNYAEALGYKLTTPYYATDISRITRKGNDGPIRTVAVVPETPIETHYLPLILTDETVVHFDSVDQCVAAVLSGKCDALYLYTRMAQEAVTKDVTNRLTSVIMPHVSAQFAMGVREGLDPRLASILEKAAASLNEEDVAAMVLKYTDHTTQPVSLESLLYSNPLFILSIVALVLVLIFAGVMLLFSTRKRKLEQEQNRQLQAALAAAEQANSAKTVFMSRMSHEIRTPLNAIIGYNSISSSTLYSARNDGRYTKATARVLECLAKSDMASKHLLSVINDVLDMSAIESGKIKLAHEPFDLQDMVRELGGMFCAQAEAQDVDFSLDVDLPGGDWFVGDRMRLNQILTNLLSNAVKFTNAGGSVRFSVYETGGEVPQVRFTVADSGIGIQPDFLKNLWAPFEQADASISRRFGGTGLGLSITRNLVELMGGSIFVESEPDVGSTFRVELPLARMAPGAEPPAQERSGKGAKPVTYDFAGARVLLAEDNRMNMEIAKSILTDWDLCVDEAWNGRQAVDMFCAAPAGTYKAILMDVHMPEMDGYRATQAIRASAHPEAATVPILAMTADVFAEDVAEAMAAGMNDHIGKPIERTVLLDALRRYIKD